VIYGLVASLYTLGSLLLTTFPDLPTSLHEAISLVDWKELVLAYVLGGTLCSASARVQTLATAFCIFWLYCFVLVYFLLPSAEIDFSFGWAFGAAALLYLITWTLHFIYHFVTPWLIARMHFWFNWRQLNHRTLLVAPPSSQFLSLQQNSSSERDEEAEETTREEGEEEDEVKLTLSSSSSSSLILQPLARGESDSSISIPFSSTSFSSSTIPTLSEVSYEYRSIANPWFCCTTRSKPSCFVYRGQVRNGRPHGRGEWRDDSFYGESLLGWWEDGLPLGPFESMERGTSNCFVSLRIAYCSIRTSWAFLPGLYFLTPFSARLSTFSFLL
jgi:hypothetical protein